MTYRYSLINPAKKPFLTLFSKIWFIFIGSVFVLLLALNLFLVFKNHSLQNNIENLKTNYNTISKDIKNIDEITAKLQEQREWAYEIFASNTILKQSLNNLFDLVPDSITLNEVIMHKNSLVIKGVTPSKDTYNMLLLAPLKSIFNTSNTTFYQLQNGWLNFISTNKINNSEGYNE
ncbi:hypothetical protein [Campylobacter sp. RM16190]|uniref:hypothetical protein n=1 Tax=Campylobacter sp. RM16190 TaxID=1705727 RepID=UPI0014741CA8|nr:hypothetical protein [Campylobacter sp. RM16190]